MQTTATAATAKQPSEEQSAPPWNTDIDHFLAGPCDYFDYSLTKMMSLSRAQLDWLHIAGLKRRFSQFRGSLPMLDKLADSQSIHEIKKLNDVLPLLFDHATYKSYPVSLLDKHRYAQLTAWLSKLTTVDLSTVDVSACHSVDDWMITLSRETPLAVFTTSGSSGTMSFLPWAKTELIKWMSTRPLTFFQRFGQDSPVEKPPLNVDCIYPFFRYGGLSHAVLNDAVVEVIAGSEERLHTAYPGRSSTDLQLLSSRYRAAEAKGQLDKLLISPELAARRLEFEAQQREMPDRINAFFASMRSKLAGKRVFIQATSNLLFTIAESGIKQGMRNVFSPRSVIVTGGGGKGIVLPDNWQDSIKEFFGTEQIANCYGMSEMSGQFTCCGYGHYHGTPWIIPFILDPDTGKPLPRSGIVTGRFAFYDLLPDTHWGGFVTGDLVTVEWDAACPCGQAGPYISGKIQRISEKRGENGEEKVSCAAAPDAYTEALEFLNRDVG